MSWRGFEASLEEMKALVERYRPARCIELQYEHLAAVASAEKREKNREFIILASREHNPQIAQMTQIKGGNDV